MKGKPIGYHVATRPSKRRTLADTQKGRLEDLIETAKAHIRATVAVRKDDDPATDQAAMANIAGSMALSGGGGLIQTTPG